MSEETRRLGSLVLELQVVVSCLIIEVWGAKLRSSGRAFFPTEPFLQPPNFTLLDLLLKSLSVAELESRICL